MRCLKLVFDRCFEAGVDLPFCTDNAGLHNVRLLFECENLLTQESLWFDQPLVRAAFRHSFACPTAIALLRFWLLQPQSSDGGGELVGA